MSTGASRVAGGPLRDVDEVVALLDHPGLAWAGRVARMGGANLIGLSRAARSELGVEIGQEVDVVVAPDVQERAVDLPPELAAALDADPRAKEAFARLSYTARKEAARGVAEAKRPETAAPPGRGARRAALTAHAAARHTPGDANRPRSLEGAGAVGACGGQPRSPSITALKVAEGRIAAAALASSGW